MPTVGSSKAAATVPLAIASATTVLTTDLSVLRLAEPVARVDLGPCRTKAVFIEDDLSGAFGCGGLGGPVLPVDFRSSLGYLSRCSVAPRDRD